MAGPVHGLHLPVYYIARAADAVPAYENVGELLRQEADNESGDAVSYLTHQQQSPT